LYAGIEGVVSLNEDPFQHLMQSLALHVNLQLPELEAVARVNIYPDFPPYE